MKPQSLIMSHRTWKQYWVVLTGPMLNFYKSVDDRRMFKVATQPINLRAQYYKTFYNFIISKCSKYARVFCPCQAFAGLQVRPGA
jgi:hypothetical protein